jgi:hypothetical protein
MNLQQPLGGWRQCASHAGAVMAAALALCWPTLLAATPLWVPDSFVYFMSGRLFTRLLLHESGPYHLEPRSAIYSMGIYLLHHNRWPWLVIAMNALLTAWIIWLVVRTAIVRRPATVYLCLIAGLSLLTTVSWYVSLLTPDILGAVLFLSMYLLIFARESLQRWEQIVCAIVVGWTTTAHPTFPVIAIGLCCFLALLRLLRWPPIRGRSIMLGQIVVLIVLSMTVQIVVNKRAFGQFSLSGPASPYLMARLIGDGPARDYLEKHCDRVHWTICLWKSRLPQDSNDFLWSPDGVYQTATPLQRSDLAAEEIPLALATLRTYPRQQLEISMTNFWNELTNFGIDQTVYESQWLVEQLSTVANGSQAHYLRGESILAKLPRRLLHTIQEEDLPVSVGICVVLLPWIWERRRTYTQLRLLGLTAVVGFILVVNAMITGIISCQDPRYEGRFIWLLPMLAALIRLNLGDSYGATVQTRASGRTSVTTAV